MKDLKSGSGAGTVAVTVANTTALGVGTNFIANFAVGDILHVGGNDYELTAIANATVATVGSTKHGVALSAGASANGDYVVSEKPRYVIHSEVGGDTTAVYGVDTSEMAYANTGSGKEAHAVAHAGWSRRTVKTDNTGATRISYETLVAGSSISGDSSDDTVLPE